VLANAYSPVRFSLTYGPTIGLDEGMTATQTAADAIAAALSAIMGPEPTIPPKLPGFVMVGASTAQDADVPILATDTIAKWLKLGGGKGCK